MDSSFDTSGQTARPGRAGASKVIGRVLGGLELDQALGLVHGQAAVAGKVDEV